MSCIRPDAAVWSGTVGELRWMMCGRVLAGRDCSPALCRRPSSCWKHCPTDGQAARRRAGHTRRLAASTVRGRTGCGGVAGMRREVNAADARSVHWISTMPNSTTRTRTGPDWTKSADLSETRADTADFVEDPTAASSLRQPSGYRSSLSLDLIAAARRPVFQAPTS